MAAKKPQVKCPGCGNRFFREDEPHIHLKNRYWHTACYEGNNKQQKKEREATNELDDFICDLFKTDFVSPRIQKQITMMEKNYGYTRSGILGSLKYWFDVKGNSTKKANNGIGIVPYIYENAREYFETVFYAHQENKGIEEIDMNTITIVITSPKRRTKKKKTVDLSFLEEGL